MTPSWWQAARRALLGAWDKGATASSDPAGDVLDRLLPLLPPTARDVVLRRMQGERTRPLTMDDVLDRAKDWSIGAGIAKGRGGYPGGSNAPGWSHYVAEQRSFLDIYKAAAGLSGDANNARRTYFHGLAATFTPSRRLMGDGYEPHVDEEARRLLYGLPVDSGIVGWAFSFEIRRADLDVLLSDPYRRAVLESVAHTKLQRSMIRGSKPVTSTDFATIVSSVLHSTPDELQRFIATVDPEHNIDTGLFVAQSMARRSEG